MYTLFQCTVHECVMDTNLDSQERLFLLTLIVKQPSSSSLLHVNFRFPNKSLKLSIFSLFLCQYNKATFYRFYKLQPLLMITIAAAVDDNNNNNSCCWRRLVEQASFIGGKDWSCWWRWWCCWWWCSIGPGSDPCWCGGWNWRRASSVPPKQYRLQGVLIFINSTGCRVTNINKWYRLQGVLILINSTGCRVTNINK